MRVPIGIVISHLADGNIRIDRVQKLLLIRCAASMVAELEHLRVVVRLLPRPKIVSIFLFSVSCK